MAIFWEREGGKFWAQKQKKKKKKETRKIIRRGEKLEKREKIWGRSQFGDRCASLCFSLQFLCNFFQVNFFMHLKQIFVFFFPCHFELVIIRVFIFGSVEALILVMIYFSFVLVFNSGFYIMSCMLVGGIVLFFIFGTICEIIIWLMNTDAGIWSTFVVLLILNAFMKIAAIQYVENSNFG